MARKHIIRCRKCWVDVATQAPDAPVPDCPLCGKKETYVHAVLTGYKKKPKRGEEDLDAEPSSSPT